MDWCHIDKFWLTQRHEIHVKNNVAHFNSCWDQHMKSQLADVNLVIWDISEFKCNVVPLYMAQMAYVEIALGVDMDWSIIPTSS